MIWYDVFCAGVKLQQVTDIMDGVLNKHFDLDHVSPVCVREREKERQRQRQRQRDRERETERQKDRDRETER